MTGPSVSTEDTRWRRLETSWAELAGGLLFVELLFSFGMHASDVLAVFIAGFCLATLKRWEPRP